jgi:hypothetical protein
MNDPQRNDIFADANGVRVAIKQLFPPNALGISFVEFKVLNGFNLEYLPKNQFLDKYALVSTFDSVDTFSRPSDIPDSKEAKTSAEPQASEGVEGNETHVEAKDSSAEVRVADEVAPTRSA